MPSPSVKRKRVAVGRNRVFATLDPEINDRAWRLAFKEHTCVGLGFDS